MLAKLQDLQDLCKTCARPSHVGFFALQCGVSATARPARPIKQHNKKIHGGYITKKHTVTHSGNEVTRKSLAGLAIPQNTLIPPWFLLQDLGVAEVLQQHEKELPA